ncbi:NHL repeat-containing protein [Magnetospirillum fulvum]|uniref:NHL repeat-containing protein n=1 Tax=Magnetospirillum fulvum TaxID=1082 RepID=A0A1H6I505_MAGFU|nr:NHL repeat-containing protein [Magnetospirillum fulvum]SEH43546.1 NHL repeat-containing protein [Magnetospirillum fulvum]
MSARRKLGFILFLGFLLLATAILVWKADWNGIEQHAIAFVRGTHATAPYRYVRSISTGNRAVAAIAVDAERRRLITVNHERLEIFDIDSGQRLRAFDDAGGVKFDFPTGIALDPANRRIWVADSGHSRIAILDAETLRQVASLGNVDQRGADDSHFSGVGQLAIDCRRGRMVVSDTGNNRVQIFDTRTLAHLGTIGVADQSGRDNHHFAYPHGVAIDEASGRYFIVDLYNSRVQVFDGDTLAYLATIGTTGQPGRDNTHFSEEVEDVAVDAANGNLLVTELGNLRIQVFDLATLTYKGTIVVGLGLPYAVAINGDDVYISGWKFYDSTTTHIYVFNQAVNK